MPKTVYMCSKLGLFTPAPWRCSGEEAGTDGEGWKASHPQSQEHLSFSGEWRKPNQSNITSNRDQEQDLTMCDSQLQAKRGE